MSSVLWGDRQQVLPRPPQSDLRSYLCMWSVTHVLPRPGSHLVGFCPGPAYSHLFKQHPLCTCNVAFQGSMAPGGRALGKDRNHGEVMPD